jgi:excisionase family DNA binding protein
MHHVLPPKTAVPERRLLRTGAAARRAGCDRGTIRRAIEKGELIAFRLGAHGNYRIPVDALEQWKRPASEEATPWRV